VGTGLDRAGAPEDDGRVGLIGRRDRRLFTIENVLVADAFDPQRLNRMIE